MVAAPFLISWNLTRRCNLHCAHCYLDAEQLDGGRGDLTTEQALLVVQRLVESCPGAMLILTGGEPLLRADLWEISAAAARGGLTPVLGSNGALLTADIIGRMVEAGIRGVGVSIDSIRPELHDRFRGQAGSWLKTMAAVDEMAKRGLEFQLQFTVTRNNYDEIPQLIALAHERGAMAANVFFLVCTGRGQRMTDITPGQYEKMLGYLVEAEAEYAGRMMVRARCAPHFLRVAGEKNPDSSLRRGSTSGCIAGRGYFRITPEGDVTPCPYMAEPVGNLLQDSFAEIWQQGPLMQSLRSPEYHGKCGICAYKEACGGCRARALAVTGDVMGEDSWCEYQPPEEPGLALVVESSEPLVWEPDAKQRLSKVPIFLRSMVKSGVERYALEKGLTRIKPELMQEMRRRVKPG